MVHPLRLLMLCFVFVTLVVPAAIGQEIEAPVAEESGEINTAPKGAGVYLVRLSEEPVVRYSGGIQGLKATKPQRGQKLDPRNPDVVKYAAYLDSRHDAVMNAAGGGRKLYDYRYAVNGFAAKLTAEQVAQLRAVPGVVSIEKDERMKPDTVSTPGMLKLTGPGGLWEQVGGVGSAGENIILGIVDTGIWPEHPSFSDRTGDNKNGVDGKLAYQQIPGWHGKCVPGEGFNASDCNQKLIGCQFFNATYREFNAFPIAESEFLSCRDSDSHGTHTASTAGGNANVEVIPGLTMSGMAPRARIASYKVCWTDTAGDNSCFNADSVAAIDQAVIDGVDVINFSIGGSTTSFLTGVSVAFLNAADAGVFVAASAGNSGPGASTVAHGGPWNTTVAASTHDRTGAGQVILGGTTVPARNGVNMAIGTGPAPLPLVHASLVGVAVDPLAKPEDEPTPFAERVNLCFVNHLDPSKVFGKIVVCDRGITARVEKGAVVKAAGGAGMILANRTATENLVADVHALPAIHVNDAPVAGVQTIRDYSKTAGATARLTDGAVASLANFTPAIASFSSRGPLRAGNGDLLKPDVSAPGVDIIAGVSPAGAGGALFASFQGTSMSSPHVAGLGAVLKQKNPTWSPMMIKSALMTTASNLSGTFAPFNQGAGHVQPSLATNPGLVYDSNANDWVKFLCGTGQLAGASCAGGNTMDPSDLNTASLAIGDMIYTQKLRRSVTNVGPTGTYTASAPVIEGLDIVVTPSQLTLATGETGHYEVSFLKNNLNGKVVGNTGFQFLNFYGSASITWSNGTHSVRSPLAIRPQGLLIATTISPEIDPATNTASAAIPVTFGYNGGFIRVQGAAAAPVALPEATVVEDTKDTFDTANPDAAEGVTKHELSTLSGLHLRIAVVATDDDPATPAKDDLDLYLYRVTKTTVTAPGAAPVVTETKALLAAAATAAALEQINLLNPTAQPALVSNTTNATTGVNTRVETRNVLYVHGFDTDGGDTKYTLNTWLARPGSPVLAGTAQGGQSATLNVSYSNLTPGTKYLGVIQWSHQPWLPFTNVIELARTVVELK